MINRTRFSSFVSLLIVFLFLFSSFTVLSAESAQFSLSHAEAQKGRLFEMALEVSGVSDLAAFIAELQYNPDLVEYRSATPCDEGAECSVNSTESGKLTVAYLCEEGVNCTDEKELITFEFKALASYDSTVFLSVRDAIDTASADISVLSCESGIISTKSGSIAAEGDNAATDKGTLDIGDTDTNTDEDSDTGNKQGSMSLFGKPVNMAVVISCSLAVLALLCAAAYFAYKLGVSRGQAKDKANIPTEKNKDTKAKSSERKEELRK